MSTNLQEKENDAVFEAEFFLTAGESDARGEMPVTLIAERIIEVATRHANLLGIGYSTLAPHGVGWVLSRLGVHIMKVPKINQYYRIATWIESWNRLFSERCFRFSDAYGNVIGWGRTIWATINFETRRVSDLSGLGRPEMLMHGMECPMEKLHNHPEVNATHSEELTFRFADLDFNRHVNSVRYIEHILNLWPLSHYDRYRIDRFEIAYRKECRAGEKVILSADMSSEDSAKVSVVRDGERVVASAVHFIYDPLNL